MEDKYSNSFEEAFKAIKYPREFKCLKCGKIFIDNVGLGEFPKCVNCKSEFTRPNDFSYSPY